MGTSPATSSTPSISRLPALNDPSAPSVRSTGLLTMAAGLLSILIVLTAPNAVQAVMQCSASTGVLSALSGNNQTGILNVPLALAFKVSVSAVDPSPVPLSDIPVTWTVIQGTGTLIPSSPTITGDNGQTQTTLTPTSTGLVTVTAQASVPLEEGSCITNLVTFTASVAAPAVLAPVLAIVSGNNQTGVINSPLSRPLVVSVANATPTSSVSWQINPSNAGSLGNGPTTSVIDGQSTNTLTLTANQGAITVTASIGASSVTFSVNNATQIATQGLKQFAALGNVALTTATVQTQNLGIRLAALRGGATGVNLTGLSFNVDGQNVSLGGVTSLIPGLQGGGASADKSLLSRLGVFANGQGTFGNQRATSQEPGSDFHTAGLTVGADYRLTDNLILGGAFGYNTGKTNLDDNGGDFSSTGYSFSAYGSVYATDRFYLDGIATFGWNHYDTERRVIFDSTPATATAKTNGTQFAISVNTGYNFNVGPLSAGPTARVNYINIHIDGFRENGAGIFNLDVDSQLIQSLTTDLGARVSYAISTQFGVLVPFFRIEWEHEYLGNSRLITGSLVADPLNTQFSASTNNPSRDYCNLGAGISAQLKHGIGSFMSFETQLGRSNVSTYSFNAGVRVDF